MINPGLLSNPGLPFVIHGQGLEPRRGKVPGLLSVIRPRELAPLKGFKGGASPAARA